VLDKASVEGAAAEEGGGNLQSAAARYAWRVRCRGVSFGASGYFSGNANGPAASIASEIIRLCRDHAGGPGYEYDQCTGIWGYSGSYQWQPDPEESVSGLEIMCILHAGMKRSNPGMPDAEIGIDLATEYTAALEIRREGQVSSVPWATRFFSVFYAAMWRPEIFPRSSGDGG